MKITEINSDELQINNSGIGALIGGLVVVVVGVSLGSWGYVTQIATNRWIGVGIGAIFLIAGIATLLTAASRRVTLRRVGTSEVTTKKLVTKKTTGITFTADQITSINFETHTEYDRTTSSDGDTRETQRRVSTIRALLRDTTEIVLATSRGGDGLVINGMNLNEFGRAPLYDEATRIASFYGVPLSNQTNNVGGIEAITGAISAVRQGIAGAQQPGVVANVQPQVQSQPQPVVATTPLQPVIPVVTPIQSVVPIAAPVQPVVPVAASIQTVQNDTVPTQVIASEQVSTGEQPPR